MFSFPSKRSLLLGGILVAAIVAAYATALRGDFLWDDDLHVSANPVIVGPLGLKEIWTTSAANYFPLVLTNFKVQHALWGLNPVGYHVVTFGCHVAAALLLWSVLLRLRVPGAGWGAAWWALHPVQVESVAWICELKNTQSAVFFLAAIWFWLRWIDRRMTSGALMEATMHGQHESRPRPVSGRSQLTDYILALVCAACAALSKPSTVMLPVALALCSWWRCGRIAGRELRALLPFLGLSAVMAGWTIWEQKFHSGAIGVEWSQTVPQRVGLAGDVIWFYLGKLIWPASLSFIYPRWTIDATEPLSYLGAAAALTGLVLLWRKRKQPRGRALLFATLYFGALLFPVLGFFDVYFFRYSFVGDHFQYLASMAPCALFAAAVAVAAARIQRIVGGAVIVGCMILTADQCRDYRNPEALWRATVTRNPGSAMAWAQLGAVHADAARHTEAIACFERALALNPKHPEALNHLGCEFLATGRTAEAIAELQRAIETRPDFPEAHSNLGIALLHAGRPQDALAHFAMTLAARPDAADTRYHQAQALAAMGRWNEAVTEYETLLRLQPEYHGGADVHNDLGVIFAQNGRMPEALAHFEAAVRLNPDDAAAQVNRGGALAQLGRLDDACAALNRAVLLQPDSANAHQYLAQILQAMGRQSEAQSHFDRAAQLQRITSPAR